MEVTERGNSAVSVLLLGCGSIGRRHARILRSMGIADIRVYDPERRQVDLLSSESGPVTVHGSVEEALQAAPDSVFVLTPPESHIPLAIEAMKADCDVFCEKPLSDSTRDLEALDACIRETGRTFMVGLCFRFHEALREAHRLVKEGGIGRILSIRGFVGEHLPTVRPDYRSLFSVNSIGVFDLIHDIDLAIWFAGEEPTATAAMYGTVSDIGISAPDLAELMMKFPSGVIASVHLDYFQIPRRRSIEIFGTRGVLKVDFSEWTHYRIEISRHGLPADVKEGRTDRDDMFREEDREFLEAAASKRPVSAGFAEGRASVEVLASVWRANASGNQGE